MLFSSYVFILLFLPITLIGYRLCQSAGQRISLLWLVAASIFFYGFWNPVHIPLFGVSVAFNYLLGQYLRTSAEQWKRNSVLAFGVVANLSVIGYFKYAGFFADAASALTGRDFSIAKIVLPLGISFFTFQQIGYLVDTWEQKVRPYTPLEYTFFVWFFPHLIAGPVVQHNDLLDQVEGKKTLGLSSRDIAVGLVLFVMGLLKKVVVADSIQPLAATVFGAAGSGQELAPISAWIGVLAYTLQLYFDFSGYSDMAIGLARMFSFQLPLNFNSPYKATSIIDFWRRWHMTLSVFLRDYLYIPLGGSRCSPVRRYFNLFLTMTLGGLWHGAGWAFVLWGALHGALLCVNHGWNAVKGRIRWSLPAPLSRSLAWSVTMICVMVGWVLFRAENMTTAGIMFRSMLGIAGAPIEIVSKAPATLLGLLTVLAGAVILPNTQQLLAAYEPALDWKRHSEKLPAVPAWLQWYSWKPTPLRGAMLAFAFVAVLTMLTRVQEFLYFQF
jgi:alginate O-acetyltransferase complex protein AlgI